MAQIFETIMLVCFGLSWPFNITKSLRARTAKGKSVMFEIVIIIGYLCGLAGKFISRNITYVAAFYVALTFRNRALDCMAAKEETTV